MPSLGFMLGKCDDCHLSVGETEAKLQVSVITENKNLKGPCTFTCNDYGLCWKQKHVKLIKESLI